MIKLLGILDSVAALSMFLIAFSISLPQKLIMVLAVCLAIKALFSLTSWISVIDLASGILLFSSLYLAIPKIAMIIAAIFLLQKGILSLFS